MPAPSSTDEFLELVRKSGLVDAPCLNAFLQQASAGGSPPTSPASWARSLTLNGLITRFQAELLLQGKWRGFRIGKYKVLELLGCGGGGNVYLCEHQTLHHRVAVKVLSQLHADDPILLQRFFREGRAGASLDHPNIARIHDLDQEGQLNYLVMDFVDGRSLSRLVHRFGPLEAARAAHYASQTARGLQFVHQAGVVHRDINPGNLILNRQGLVKILDLGVARIIHEAGCLTAKGVILGTADYLAPEQAIDGHSVDSRADIYGLGATLYFLLTGHAPFEDAPTLAQKLIGHQTKPPRPIRDLRSDVPEALAAVVIRMMAKDPNQRFQTAGEVIEALAPWTKEPIPPPPASEMPSPLPPPFRPGAEGSLPAQQPSVLADSGILGLEKTASLDSGAADSSVLPQELRGKEPTNKSS
jgi:serine/threonine protein kinase